MKEQGPNPHVPQVVKDLQLAELTEHTESNTPQILYWALDIQWGCFWAGLLQEMILYERFKLGVRTWSTINTLQVNESWKNPSVQTRPVARIMEKHTGSCDTLSSTLPRKTENLKMNLRQGKNYLVGTYWSRALQSITINLFQSCPEHISFSPDVWFCFFFLEQRVFLSSVCCNLK